MAEATGSIGDVDPAFGNSGTAVFDINGGDWDDAANTVLALPGGDAYIIGTAAQSATADAATVIRVAADGSLDSTFGTGGVASYAPALGATARDGVLVDDGVVIVGSAEALDGGSPITEAVIVRFTGDGELNTDFGTNGILQIAGGSSTRATAVTATASGSLVVAGEILTDSEWQPIVWMLDQSGTLDASFGTQGVATTRVVEPDQSSGTVEVNGLAIDEQGRVVLVGSVSEYPTSGLESRHMLLVRFTAEGELDTAFGADGIVTQQPDAAQYVSGTALQIADDGRIVVAGYRAGTSANTTDGMLLRFAESGAIDPSLGSGSGSVLYDGSSGGNDLFRDVIVTERGEIVAVGSVAASGATDAVVVRFNGIGELDQTFGTSGTATLALGVADEARAVVADPDGDLLVAGVSERSAPRNDDDWFVAHVLVDTEALTTIDDQAPRPGDEVVLSYVADTFTSGESVAVELVPGGSIGTGTAEADGSLELTVEIPIASAVGPASIIASGQSSKRSVTTPITVSGDVVTGATDIDYAQPGQFDMEPCSSATDTDCIESAGYYTSSGDFISAGFLENNDPSDFVCEDGHIFDSTGAFWNFPGLESEVGNSLLLVGPTIKTPNFNHNCTRSRVESSDDELVADEVYVSVYAAINSDQGYNQMGVAEPRTDCPEPSNDNPHTETSCQRGGGPGGDELIEVTLRVSGFAPAFAYTSTSDTEVETTTMADGSTKVTLRGRSLQVPGVWDSSSFDEGSLRTAEQADYLEQMWFFHLKNANDPNFPVGCSEFGFPVIAGNHAWGGQPEWDSTSGELVFNMGAPHLRPDGDPFEGQYEARIPVAYAECLWGVDPQSLVTDLEVVVEDEGVVRDETEFDASITIVDDVLHIDADGFHFSEPDVIVRSTSTSSFIPLSKPARILDTRSGVGAEAGRVGAIDGSGSALELTVAGAGGVPSSGVDAVALNVTVVDGEANDFGGFVTVYPCGTRPDSSNLNFVSGQTIPNSVIAPVSSSGTVCFYVYGTANLLADVSGYFASGFSQLTPSRILDTRNAVGAPAARVGAIDGSGSALELTVAGKGGVPSSGVDAVALNVTVVDGQANDFGGFVTVYPCGTRPDSSNLNFVSGQTIPNSVIAPVSSSGKVCFYVYGTANLLADVSGYFASGFSQLTPARILDTRNAVGAPAARVGAIDGSGSALELTVAGAGGVPSSGVDAVALNVTVVDGEANDFGGFVTVYPCGTRPDSSNLNFVSGQTIPNSVIAPVSSSGKVCFYVYGTANLLADVSGYFGG